MANVRNHEIMFYVRVEVDACHFFVCSNISSPWNFMNLLSSFFSRNSLWNWTGISIAILFPILLGFATKSIDFNVNCSCIHLYLFILFSSSYFEYADVCIWRCCSSWTCSWNVSIDTARTTFNTSRNALRRYRRSNHRNGTQQNPWLGCFNNWRISKRTYAEKGLKQTS